MIKYKDNRSSQAEITEDVTQVGAWREGGPYVKGSNKSLCLEPWLQPRRGGSAAVWPGPAAWGWGCAEGPAQFWPLKFQTLVSDLPGLVSNTVGSGNKDIVWHSFGLIFRLNWVQRAHSKNRGENVYLLETVMAPGILIWRMNLGPKALTSEELIVWKETGQIQTKICVNVHIKIWTCIWTGGFEVDLTASDQRRYWERDLGRWVWEEMGKANILKNALKEGRRSWLLVKRMPLRIQVCDFLAYRNYVPFTLVFLGLCTPGTQ